MDEEYINLTEEQEKIFKKYGIEYDQGNNSDEQNRYIDCQKYVYAKMQREGADKEGIIKLLDMTLHEIDTQYVRKEQFEIKLGFLAALWGVISTVILQNNVIDRIKDNLFNVDKNCVRLMILFFLIVIVFVTGIVSLIYIFKGIAAQKYKRFCFEERIDNFKCAVDDVCLFYVVMLEGSTNAWKHNEGCNEKKAHFLKQSLATLIVYILSVVIFMYYI